jgi:glyoxylase-like metal-dependent hydrolase (beta-lactamase superfamily II)
MAHINTEGKFNDNTYLLDAELYKLKGSLAIYVIDNEGMRVMIDAPSELGVRKFIKKLNQYGLYPIHKIILTHSHFDHVQGVEKLKKLMPESEIEILASENAINNLKNPEKMNKIFGYKVPVIENVTPLNEGDIVNVNGLKLEIFNFFGHTQDSIAILDSKNKNIFVGDAIIDRFDQDTHIPEFAPPDFNEFELLKSFEKLRTLKHRINSISMPHFGVWTENDYQDTINMMERFHFDTKSSIIQWYNENSSLEYITAKYHEKFTPNSTIHTKENIHGLELLIEWQIIQLKRSGDIK